MSEAHAEYCINDEWLTDGICRDYDMEDCRDEIGHEYRSVAIRAAEAAGLTVERAQGQRILFHPWNGAHFTGRAGVFGWFGDLTPEQVTALEAADEAGYVAARKLAQEIATSRATDEM